MHFDSVLRRPPQPWERILHIGRLARAVEPGRATRRHPPGAAIFPGGGRCPAAQPSSRPFITTCRFR
jgi:hypothetical protein